MTNILLLGDDFKLVSEVKYLLKRFILFLGMGTKLLLFENMRSLKGALTPNVYETFLAHNYKTGS